MTHTHTLAAPAGQHTSRVELVVLDMAGTTVRDDGLVERAFGAAADATGVANHISRSEALKYVRQTMGQSKIEVFTHLAEGDRTKAEEATTAFEEAYADLIAEEGVQPIAGARETLQSLRRAGLAVVLTTGFAPSTRDSILRELDWSGLVDAALSPVDVGRGRPAPDLVLAAALGARVSSMASVVVVGDTASDIASGRAAGARLTIGVLTGAHDRSLLQAAGADEILDDLTALPALLGLDI